MPTIEEIRAKYGIQAPSQPVSVQSNDIEALRKKYGITPPATSITPTAPAQPSGMDTIRQKYGIKSATPAPLPSPTITPPVDNAAAMAAKGMTPGGLLTPETESKSKVGQFIASLARPFLMPFGEVAKEVFGSTNLPTMSSSAIDAWAQTADPKQMAQIIKQQHDKAIAEGKPEQKGAGFTDVLGTLMFLPEVGIAAKAADSFEAIKAGELNTKLLTSLGKGLKAGAASGLKWGTGFGVANALDNGVTDPKELLKQGAFSGLVTAAAGGMIGIAAAGVGRAASRLTKAGLTDWSNKINEMILNRPAKVVESEQRAGQISVPEMMRKYNLVGDKTTMAEQADEIANQKAQQVQEILKSSAGANAQHDLRQIQQDVIQGLKKSASEAGSKLNSTEVKSYTRILKDAFASAIDTHGATVDTVTLNQIKQDFWKAAKFGETDFVAKNTSKEFAGHALKTIVESVTQDVPIKDLNAELGDLLHTRNQLLKYSSTPVKKTISTWMYPILGTMFGLEKGSGLSGAVLGTALRHMVDQTTNNPEMLSKVSQVLYNLANSDDPQVSKIADEYAKMLEKQSKPGISEPVSLSPRRALPAPAIAAQAPAYKPFTPEEVAARQPKPGVKVMRPGQLALPPGDQNVSQTIPVFPKENLSKTVIGRGSAGDKVLTGEVVGKPLSSVEKAKIRRRIKLKLKNL